LFGIYICSDEYLAFDRINEVFCSPSYTEWFWRMISGGRKTFIRNVKCVSHISLVLAKDFFRYKIFRQHKKD